MTQANTLFRYHLDLLQAFLDAIAQQPPFNQSEIAENDQEFIEHLRQLCRAQRNDENVNSEGQQALSKVIANYPHLTPLLHRDLLWFFGGDCLHYMPDDEIEKFQQLDERRYAAEDKGEEFHYEDERAKVFGLH